MVLKASGSAGDTADRDGTLRAISFCSFSQAQGMMDAFSLGFFFAGIIIYHIIWRWIGFARGERDLCRFFLFSRLSCLLPSSIIILDLRFLGVKALARRGLVVVAGYWAHKRGMGGRDAAKR